MNKDENYILSGIAAVVFNVVIALLVGLMVFLMWNPAIPNTFEGVGQIKYFDAVFLYLIIKFLFGFPAKTKDFLDK